MDHDVREFFKQQLTRDELQSILDRSGMKPSEMVSTRSSVYRNEKLAERTISDEEWIERLLAEPRLIRRPILVSDSGVEVGFSKARWQELADELAM